MASWYSGRRESTKGEAGGKQVQIQVQEMENPTDQEGEGRETLAGIRSRVARLDYPSKEIEEEAPGRASNESQERRKMEPERVDSRGGVTTAPRSGRASTSSTIGREVKRSVTSGDKLETKVDQETMEGMVYVEIRPRKTRRIKNTIRILLFECMLRKLSDSVERRIELEELAKHRSRTKRTNGYRYR